MTLPVDGSDGVVDDDPRPSDDVPSHGATPTSAVGPRRWLVLVVVTAVTLVLDQSSKSWVVSALEFGDPVHLIGSLRLNLAFNTGMAFSRGANSGPLIGLVALGIVAVMLVLARRTTAKVQLMAIGVIVGGALGNVVDRLLRAGPPLDGGGFMNGAVVDFIDLQFWPIFNVADMAVVVGGLVLAASMIWVDDATDDAAEDATEDGDDDVPTLTT